MHYVVLIGISDTIWLPWRRQSRSTHAGASISPRPTVRIGYQDFPAICRA